MPRKSPWDHKPTVVLFWISVALVFAMTIAPAFKAGHWGS